MGVIHVFCLWHELMEHRQIGVGHQIDIDRSICVDETHLRQRPGKCAGKMQPGFRLNGVGKSQPLAAVVIAADGKHRHIQLKHNLRNEGIEKRHRFHRRIAAVVDIPGEDQRVRPFRANARDDLIENEALVVDHRITIDLFADVKVGQMK